jgi:hypothetical protein
MATAFFLPLSHLLQALAAFFAPPRAVAVPCAVSRPAARRMAQPAPAKPLRVVRVLEPSAPRAIAGRMVISGRLADVCAELDRLAALEAR